jgi:tetratricopeptide (TPR) repeat protein
MIGRGKGMKFEDMPPAQRRKWKALMSAYGKNQIAYTFERVQKYLDKYPNDGVAWYIFGKILSKFYRYDEAIYALRRALKIFPKRRLDMVYIQLGELYETKGSYRAAERWFRKAVDHGPKRTTSLIILSVFLIKPGRFSEAKHYLRRAIRLGRDGWDEAYYNLGLIHIYEGKYAQALGFIRKSLEIDPKYMMAKKAHQDIVEVLKVRAKC